MMFRKHLASILLLLLLGCAPPRPPIVVKDDEFSQSVEVDGAPDSVWYRNGAPFGKWYLRSWIDKRTRQVTHQLYVYMIIDGGYQYFHDAADDTARSLPVTTIDRTAECRRADCLHYETIGVAVDDATLRARAAGGIRFKLSARRGDELVVTLSPTQIALQLAAVDHVLHPPAPAAPPAAK